jgi:RecA-family ATPase
MTARKVLTAAEVEATKLFKPSQIAPQKEECEKWLVPGWLPAHGTSLFYGKPRSGKTTLTRQLAVACAKGGDFLGRTVTQGKVVILYQEENPDFLKVYFDKLGVTDADPLWISVKPITENPLARVERVLIDNPGTKLLIIDPIMAMMDKDIKEHKEINFFMKRIARLALKYKTHICVVHHSNKATREDGRDNAAGSHAFTSNSDFPLELIDDASGARWITARPRYGKAVEKTKLTYDSERQIFGIGSTQAEIKHVERQSTDEKIQSDILKFVLDNPNCSQEALLYGVQAKTASFYKNQTILIKSGAILRFGSGKKGDGHTYLTNTIPTQEITAAAAVLQ